MMLRYPVEDSFHMLPRHCFANAAEALLRLARERIVASAASATSQ